MIHFHSFLKTGINTLGREQRRRRLYFYQWSNMAALSLLPRGSRHSLFTHKYRSLESLHSLSALTAGDGNSDGFLYLQAWWSSGTYESSRSFITFLSVHPLLAPGPWLPIYTLKDFGSVFEMLTWFAFWRNRGLYWCIYISHIICTLFSSLTIDYIFIYNIYIYIICSSQ